MLREHDRELRTLLLLTDIVLCAAVFAIGYARGWGGLQELALAVEPWKVFAFSATAALTLPIALRTLRAGRSTRLESLALAAREVLTAGGIAAVVLAAAAYLLGAPFGPAALYTGLLAQIFVVGLVRLSALGGLQLLRRSGRNYRNVLVVGTGPRAQEFTETLARHPEWGLRIVGYVDEGDFAASRAIPHERVFKMADFPELLRKEVVDEVVTACPRSMLASLGPALETCSASGLPLTVLTDLFGDYLPPPRVKQFASLEALSFAPVHHSPARLAVKRLLDIAGAAAGLTITSPVLLLSALAIRLDSAGPIFFRQIRSGVNGRPFVIYKLRTMVTDAEAQQERLRHLNEMQGPVFKMRADPRVTRVGHFLRAFSIDELPQLWNVLVGDMSLVGPRPPIPAEVAQYETSERRRLSMRPGLTCLWQVRGRNALTFDEWVRLDLHYIDNWSLINDLKILLATVPAVLSGTGR